MIVARWVRNWSIVEFVCKECTVAGLQHIVVVVGGLKADEGDMLRRQGMQLWAV